jgi:hypothetical protein
VHLFEHFEHTDVGAALGAAAGEYQPHPRALREGGCRTIDVIRWRRDTESRQQPKRSDQLRAGTH